MPIWHVRSDMLDMLCGCGCGVHDERWRWDERTHEWRMARNNFRDARIPFSIRPNVMHDAQPSQWRWDVEMGTKRMWACNWRAINIRCVQPNGTVFQRIFQREKPHSKWNETNNNFLCRNNACTKLFDQITVNSWGNATSIGSSSSTMKCIHEKKVYI